MLVRIISIVVISSAPVYKYIEGFIKRLNKHYILHLLSVGQTFLKGNYAKHS